MWLRIGPLTLPARRQLGAMLTAVQGAHPWPDRIPSSRFGQLPPQPVDYTPAEPEIVVEVDADVCFEQDRWRHATVFGGCDLTWFPRTLPGLPQFAAQPR